jgi:DNA adenine methylase
MVVDKESTSTTPFLRWAGSKRQVLPQLAAYWNFRFSRYIEPFAGSASLFFYLAPRQAILADINHDLIFTYVQVRDNLLPVSQALGQMKNGRQSYYRWRDHPPANLDSVQKAARFIFLNRYCFNGLYRTNRLGKFNVPYGGTKTGQIPSREHLATCASLLAAARLYASSYEDTIQLTVPGDFVYLDPPYNVHATRIFKEYGPATFNEVDLKKLREHLLCLDKKGVAFVLSYCDCEEARLLSRGFSSRIIFVRRNIAGFASNRRIASELLISNCPPTDNL